MSVKSKDLWDFDALIYETFAPYTRTQYTMTQKELTEILETVNHGIVPHNNPMIEEKSSYLEEKQIMHMLTFTDINGYINKNKETFINRSSRFLFVVCFSFEEYRELMFYCKQNNWKAYKKAEKYEQEKTVYVMFTDSCLNYIQPYITKHNFDKSDLFQGNGFRSIPFSVFKKEFKIDDSEYIRYLQDFNLEETVKCVEAEVYKYS